MLTITKITFCAIYFVAVVTKRLDTWRRFLLDHNNLKMLAKIYDHTSAETLYKVLLKTKPGAEARRGAPTVPPFHAFWQRFFPKLSTIAAVEYTPCHLMR